jgi:hypothetical protein
MNTLALIFVAQFNVMTNNHWFQECIVTLRLTENKNNIAQLKLDMYKLNLKVFRVSKASIVRFPQVKSKAKEIEFAEISKWYTISKMWNDEYSSKIMDTEKEVFSTIMRQKYSR